MIHANKICFVLQFKSTKLSSVKKSMAFDGREARDTALTRTEFNSTFDRAESPTTQHTTFYPTVRITRPFTPLQFDADKHTRR